MKHNELQGGVQGGLCRTVHERIKQRMTNQGYKNLFFLNRENNIVYLFTCYVVFPIFKICINKALEMQSQAKINDKNIKSITPHEVLSFIVLSFSM